MTYVISLKDSLEAGGVFHRANSALIDKLGGTDFIVRKADFLQVHHLRILAQGWQDYYNIKIIEENNNWKSLEFANEKHYTMFVLKWTV